MTTLIELLEAMDNRPAAPALPTQAQGHRVCYEIEVGVGNLHRHDVYSILER